MKSTVSVVIPHFNAIKTLERSINSVLSQTRIVDEIIIIDDASNNSNNPEFLIQKFKIIFPEIYLYVNNKNMGAAFSRNRGLDNCKFHYVAFLDSDDIWHPQKIEIQLSLMQKYNLTLSGHGYIQNFNDTKENWTHKEFKCTKISKILFTIKNPFFTPTVMIKRNNFIYFDQKFRRCDDYKCWLENFDGNYIYISANLAAGYKRAIGDSGLTSSIWKMHTSFIFVLNDLLKTNTINFLFYLLAIFVENVKMPLRFLYKFLSAIRKS